MNHCTYTGIFRISQVQALHQLCIAGCHLSAVHFGSYTMSADFLHVTDVRGIQFFSISILQALADGMAGITLRISSILQQFFLCETLTGIDARYIEYTFGQGTGLVKYHILSLRQCLQIVGSLHQNTTGTCCSDSSEERRGMEMTSAQGQLITRKVSARMIQVLQAAGLPMIRLITGGRIARARAL